MPSRYPFRPVVAISVAVAEPPPGDRVAICLIANQDAAEMLADLLVEGLDNSAKFAVIVDQFRDCFSESRASLVDG
jgi:hypothetical protein